MAENKNDFVFNKDREKTINIEKDRLDAVTALDRSFFTGLEDQINLNLDPIVTGYSFICWLQTPSWFDEDPDLKNFKALTERNFRSFSGINGLDLQTATVQTGFAGHEINVATGIQRTNTDFTIGHKEYSGTPMTKMYQKWVSMIRDPRTGIALYPKLYGIDYGARNHSAQLLYIVTRPDVTNTTKQRVEFAMFYSNVIPTNVPLDTLFGNFEIGQQDSPTIEINFKGFPEFGPHVNAFAEKVLNERIISHSGEGDGLFGDHYIPFVDSYNTMYNTNDDKTTNNITWASVMDDIYTKED